jgi:chemotaxis protein CheZ
LIVAIAATAPARGASEPDELEALFDSIADERQRELRGDDAAPATPADAAGAVDSKGAGIVIARTGAVVKEPMEMFQRIGQLTRQLHEALREVGADSVIERAAREFPDARDRLGYIARLTEQAAERTLAAVEIGQSRQGELGVHAAALAGRWERFFGRDLTLAEFRALAGDTRLFMAQAQSTAEATNAQLLEIMMAQDFQDLTGQVIQKLTRVVNEFESQLLQFLIEAIPEGHAKPVLAGDDLEGPIVNGGVRKDVVASQAQVDDLLESLGF